MVVAKQAKGETVGRMQPQRLAGGSDGLGMAALALEDHGDNGVSPVVARRLAYSFLRCLQGLVIALQIMQSASEMRVGSAPVRILRNHVAGALLGLGETADAHQRFKTI